MHAQLLSTSLNPQFVQTLVPSTTLGFISASHFVEHRLLIQNVIHCCLELAIVYTDAFETAHVLRNTSQPSVTLLFVAGGRWQLLGRACTICRSIVECFNYIENRQRFHRSNSFPLPHQIVLLNSMTSSKLGVQVSLVSLDADIFLKCLSIVQF